MWLQILMHHVRDCLPDLKARISTQLLEVQVCVGRGGGGK
jgi:hypothetical protein